MEAGGRGCVAERMFAQARIANCKISTSNWVQCLGRLEGPDVREEISYFLGRFAL